MAGSGKDRAVVFVTDAGFLMPSLVAACQVSCQPQVMACADIFLLLVDLDEGLERSLAAEFSGRKLNFLRLDSKLFEPGTGTFFNPAHISRTALGRLVLHEVLPPSYRHVIYLDGDVQIIGDIAPLVMHDVKPGCIAAANDFLWLRQGRVGGYWRRHRQYLQDIGVDRPADYFNSGVIAFELDTWREMAPRALEYFQEFSGACRYHDQSALNHVFFDRREMISPVYNFATDFSLLGLAPETKPRILHFTGMEKPWWFDGPPWNGCFLPVYRRFCEEHPLVRPFLRTPDKEALAASQKALRNSQLKSALRTPWRHWQRRKKFRRYMDETAFAVR